MRWWLGRIAIILGLFLILLSAAIFLLLWSGEFFTFPDFSKVGEGTETSIIYDAEEQVIKKYCLRCREAVVLSQMGHFPQIAVAVEDKNFWERKTAFDPLAIIRAFITNLKNVRIKEGGSTITQQLARIIFLEEELRYERLIKQSDHGFIQKKGAQFWRKGREAWIATQLQQYLDKNRQFILELYLNHVWCGHGYGVKSCSNNIFSKNPKELSIGEAALIAGLWRNPDIPPFGSDKKTLELRERVLVQLAREGMIDEKEKYEFGAHELPERKKEKNTIAQHFAEYVRREITKKNKLVDAGLRIYTTLNLRVQEVAQLSLNTSVEAMKNENQDLQDLRGTVLLVDRFNGGIVAFAQYPEFEENQYLIDQIKRQAGSALKPLTYLTFLRLGGRLSCEDETALDEKQKKGPCLTDDSYGPSDGPSAVFLSMGKNTEPKYIQNFPYTGRPRYRSYISPLLAFSESRNVGTMCLLKGVKHCRIPGIITKEDILETILMLGIHLPTSDTKEARPKGTLIKYEVAKRLGISSYTPDPGHTVAIGGGLDVSSFDMLRAISAMTGKRIDPYGIEEVLDRNGLKIFSAEPKPQEIFSEKIQHAMLRGLRATVEYKYKGKYVGTAARTLSDRELYFPIFGKTGTATNRKGDTTDNSFVGCSAYFCMYVWIGRENKMPLKSVEIKNEDGTLKETVQQTGGKNALPVFIEVIKEAHRNWPTQNFPEHTDPNSPFIYKNEDVETQSAPTETTETQKGNDF